MIYKEGSSLEIKGRFTCVFKDYQNDIVKIKNLERDFIFCIKGSDIINTNIKLNSKDLIDINDWLEKPVNSKGKTEKQIHKLSDAFLESYIKDGSLSLEMKNSLKELNERGIYDGDVIDDYSKLLERPYEILIKSIFNIEKQKNGSTHNLFTELFKKHISNNSVFITFEANTVQKGKKGVYFFTFNDKIVYVGKSSNFYDEYQGYKSGRVPNSFPNNNGTRGKINMKIAEKVRISIQPPNIKWYNMSIDKSNIDDIFQKLEQKGIDIKNTFNKINPKLDFFETLIMSMNSAENWNDDRGGFIGLVEIDKTQ